MLPQRILLSLGLGLTAAVAACGDSGGPGTPPKGTISGTITLTNLLLSPAAPKSALPGVTAFVAPADPVASKAARPTFRRLGMVAGQPEYRADELIVTYRAGPLGAPAVGSFALATPTESRQAAQAIATRLAAPAAAGRLEVRGVSPVILAARVRATGAASLDSLAAELRRDPAVATVERNAIYRAFDPPRGPAAPLATNPNDPLYPVQAWHYAAIDLPEAWDITGGSPTVLVAVVDDGIRFDHPGIALNLTSDGYDFTTNDPLELCAGGTIGSAGDGDGYDSNPTQPAAHSVDPSTGCVGPLDELGNHGLHVAGTIGARGNDGVGVTGVNWIVRIRPVRVLGVTGSGSSYDVAQGILYAAGLPADNGLGGTVAPATRAKVINLSLGGGASTDVENAVIAATNAGSLIVASAGNAATSVPNYPAAFPQALSVSAVGPDLVLASYSSFGPTVDVAAPGGDFDDGDATFGVLSTLWNFATNMPVYAFGNGTSMAAPHVTGVAALLLAQTPSLTGAEIRARLEAHVVDLGTPGRDDSYGAGLINARAALTQGVPPARQLFVRLYDDATGAIVQTVAAQGSGAFSVSGLAEGRYLVFAGEDENGEGQTGVGVPGRRWGAFGGSTVPNGIDVAGGRTFQASFSIGFPSELEANNSLGLADYLAVGGYLSGAISSGTDLDYFFVRIPTSGVYTFETSGVDGACGFALEEDTILRLYTLGGTELASNDDINTAARNHCSRIVRSLTPGVYVLRVEEFTDPQAPAGFGYRYRVRARAGS